MHTHNAKQMVNKTSDNEKGLKLLCTQKFYSSAFKLVLKYWSKYSTGRHSEDKNQTELFADVRTPTEHPSPYTGNLFQGGAQYANIDAYVWTSDTTSQLTIASQVVNCQNDDLVWNSDSLKINEQNKIVCS